VQELMAVSGIVINERVEVEVRTEGALDLTLLEKAPVDLTLVESDLEIDDDATDDDDDVSEDTTDDATDSAVLIGTGEALPPELAWQERALCAQTDPEAFFPEKGGSTREAKRVCMSCEVRAECLDYALAKDERFGIWGGLSERERRRVKKQAV
jgi:WhiB family transcriptional regulator, redox-sensing transcriptional regulator